MSDPLTTSVVAASGLMASKEIITKLLGPTADYIGESIRDIVKKNAENIGHVFQVSCEKLKNDIERPGQVNLRVLKNIWDEGRFVEDSFSAEYFGGILASARTKDGTDDSAIPFVSLVKSLSSHQLRLHFVIYRLVALYSSELDEAGEAFLRSFELQISTSELLKSLDLKGVDGHTQLQIALLGLMDQGLIDEPIEFIRYITSRYRGFSSCVSQ